MKFGAKTQIVALNRIEIILIYYYAASSTSGIERAQRVFHLSLGGISLGGRLIVS